MKADVQEYVRRNGRQVELPPEIFEAPVNMALMHQALPARWRTRAWARKDQDSQRSYRRHAQDLEAEGHWARPPGLAAARRSGRAAASVHTPHPRNYTQADAAADAPRRAALGLSRQGG